MMRPTVATLIASLALAFTIIIGAIWQFQQRIDQQVVIGGALDDGAVSNFQEREQSAFLGNQPFRWSRPTVQLRFWAIPQPAILTLHLIAPSVPGFSQYLTLQASATPLGAFPIAPEQRRYRLLVPANQASGDLLINLASERFPGDTRRELGLVFTAAALNGLSTTPWNGIVAELWQMPLLPLTLLLSGLLGLRSTQSRRLSILLCISTPLLVLAILSLGTILFPNMGLLLAEYALCITITIGLALVLLRLLRHFPQLRPDDDQRAHYWIVLTFVLALAFTFSPSMRSDGVGYYVYLRSLAIDGDLHFDNEYDALLPVYKPGDVPTLKTGYLANPWSVGPAFWWAPGFGIAHVLVLASYALGGPWQPNGYDQPYIVMTDLTSALAGLATMLICYRISRRWVAPPIVTLAIISLVFGSNILYYMTRWGCYAHALAAMLASLFVLAWLRLEEQPSMLRWVMLGIAAGAMIQTYWVSGLALILALLTFARILVAALRGPTEWRMHTIKQLILGSTAAAVIALVIFSPQMIAWQIIYGSPVTIPQGNGFATPGASRILTMLIGQPYGLLFWTPALFLGIVGLALLWRPAPWLCGCLMLAFALYFWYNSTIPDWHGSGGFGLRRMTLLAPWCAIGLGLLYDALHRRQAALPVVLTMLMGGWILMLLVRLDHSLIPFRAIDLEQRPFAEFVLSRNALPLWDVPKFLLGSHFADQIRNLGSPFVVPYLICLITIIALSIWGILRISGRNS